MMCSLNNTLSFNLSFRNDNKSTIHNFTKKECFKLFCLFELIPTNQQHCQETPIEPPAPIVEASGKILGGLILL